MLENVEAILKSNFDDNPHLDSGSKAIILNVILESYLCGVLDARFFDGYSFGFFKSNATEIVAKRKMEITYE